MLPIKLTPIYTTAHRLGAHFGEQHGWRMVENFAPLDDEVEAARRGIAIADESTNGKLRVEGREAEAVVRTAFGVADLVIGAGAAVESGCVYRLRRDLFFVSTPPGAETALHHKLVTSARALNQFVTVTDVTHGLAELRVIGPACREVLSKLCGLDFHPTAFANGTAKPSSLAKTVQLIIRRDVDTLPAFSIIGAQSLGAYLWDTLMHAGREQDIRPIGRNALAQL